MIAYEINAFMIAQVLNDDALVHPQLVKRLIHKAHGNMQLFSRQLHQFLAWIIDVPFIGQRKQHV